MSASASSGVRPSVMDAAGAVAQARRFVWGHLPEFAVALFYFLNLLWVALWSGAQALPVHVIFISLGVVFVVWQMHKRQLAAERERALFANAPHELMTPLRIASGELELLGRNGHAPTVEEFYETRRLVLDELHRGQLLAAGLLTLTRLDTSFSAQQRMTPTNDLLDAAVRRWSGAKRRPLVIAERAGGELSCVRPDIGLLLDSLIENAFRHSPEGSRVTLAARSRGRHLVLEVSDEGAGIPQAVLPHVFDRFFHGRSADEARGNGLGLAIVKAIAEGHHGSVDVESELGVGTTFRVELPGFASDPGRTRVAAEGHHRGA